MRIVKRFSRVERSELLTVSSNVYILGGSCGFGIEFSSRTPVNSNAMTNSPLPASTCSAEDRLLVGNVLEIVYRK